MSIFHKGLIAAMEEQMEAETAELAPSGIDSVEADMVEATDISGDVEAGVREVEQTVQDAETLGRIQTIAQNAAENEGGLDPVAAEIAEVAVEAIYTRLNYKQGTFPSMESFSSRSSRSRATRVAIEGIADTLKKIWAAIVAAFRRFIDFIKGFFRKVFDANEKLQVRLIKLKKEIQDGKDPDMDKFISGSGSIAKALHGKNREQIISNAGNVLRDLKNILTGTQNYIDGLKTLPEITKHLKREKSLENKELVELQNNSGGLEKVFNSIAGAKDSIFKDYFEAEINKEGTFTVSINNPFSDAKDIDLSPLPKTEMMNFINFALDINVEVKKNKHFEKSLQNGLDAVNMTVRQIEQTIEYADKDTVSAQRNAYDNVSEKQLAENARVVQRVVTNIGNTAIKVAVKTINLSFNAAKGMADYVERSLDVNESGKKKNEDETSSNTSTTTTAAS